MRRAALVLLALLLALPGIAGAKRKRGPKVIEKKDGDLIHLYLEDDPKAQGWLYRPLGTEEPEEPVDLIVGLHGAGGNPKNFFLRRLMDQREAWCLTVAGHTAVTHDRGQGFQWDFSGTTYVGKLTQYLLDTYPLRKERVIVWGHSAGGSMSLETLATHPKLFAGALSTAAPRQPDSRHKACRVAVFLGTKDPNWSGAPSVRSYAEKLLKKRSKGACAFFAVDGLGHSVPAEEYLGLGFDWILQPKARGGEARVGQSPKGVRGKLRHILVRHKGAEGAPRGLRRSAGAAKKLLGKIRKELGKGRAWFPFEAACHSEDEETASCGGGVDEETLAEFGIELPELEPGKVSAVLPGKNGLHLVYREPE
jgi:predicted esterase